MRQLRHLKMAFDRSKCASAYRRMIAVSAYVHFFGVFDFFIWFESFFSRSTTCKQNENSLNKNCEVKISFIFLKFLLSPNHGGKKLW